MTTAQRVRHLLDKHGHSIREASRRSGVPRATLQRIVGGSEANLDRWIPTIASTYNVEPQSLWGGRDPKSDVEWWVRQASLKERSDLMSMSVQERLRMVLEFLTRVYAQKTFGAQLAMACGTQADHLSAVLAQWELVPPDLATTRSIIENVHALTGISRSWFFFGILGDEPGTVAVAHQVPRASLPAQGSGRASIALLVRDTRAIAMRRLDGTL